MLMMSKIKRAGCELYYYTSSNLTRIPAPHLEFVSSVEPVPTDEQYKDKFMGFFCL